MAEFEIKVHSMLFNFKEESSFKNGIHLKKKKKDISLFEGRLKVNCLYRYSMKRILLSLRNKDITGMISDEKNLVSELKNTILKEYYSRRTILKNIEGKQSSMYNSKTILYSKIELQC